MEAQNQFRTLPEWQAMVQRYGPGRVAMWQWIRVAPDQFREALISHARTVIEIRRLREAQTRR